MREKKRKADASANYPQAWITLGMASRHYALFDGKAVPLRTHDLAMQPVVHAKEGSISRLTPDLIELLEFVL